MHIRRLFLLLLAWAGAAFAGGGPETTLLVVNAASPVSVRVAAEYARLRDLPPGHVLYLEGVPGDPVIDLDTFLERIWKPVRSYLDAQGLADQVDLVLWSADFPFGVDFRKRHDDNFARASLNGLTYLMPLVEDERPFWALDTNPYYGVLLPRQMTEPERALWNEAAARLGEGKYADAAEIYRKILANYENGVVRYNLACCLARLSRPVEALDELERAAAAGFRNPNQAAQDEDLAAIRNHPRFREILGQMTGSVAVSLRPSSAFPGNGGGYLSVHLAHTGRYGNSVPEVLAYLKAAAGSDGTHPDGTVYFCRNGDIRSKTREEFWPKLEEELKRRGRKVELVDSVLPPEKPDVIGAVLGIAGFDWAKCKSRILPGAICEHLTSHGANFATAGQTKLSELLRYGAAGASGTVHEPYALHPKFPNPLIHVFYADGCSLAEAFYQSVWGPYQLMIVGDGLARPFATFGEVAVEAPPAPWKGVVKITGGRELWVDGRRVAEGGTYELDTTALADGWHDVRVVAVADDPVATRSYRKVEATVDNHGRKVSVAVKGGAVEVKAAGARAYRLRQGSRVVAEAGDGRFRSEGLGPGPLQPEAEFADGAWIGAPLDLPPAPPAYAPPSADTAGPFKPGLRGTGVRPFVAPNLGDRDAGLLLGQLAEVKGAERITLDGQFQVPGDGLYELVVRGRGTLTIAGLCEEAALDGTLFLPAALAAGWHDLRVDYRPRGNAGLEVLLGGDCVLQPLSLRHASFPALKDRPAAEKGQEALLDGKHDAAVKVPPEGIVLTFRKVVRDVAALTLWPEKGSPNVLPDWQVEVLTSGSKWKPVKDLQQIIARPARVAKDQPETPVFIELSFAPERAKKLRLTLKGQASLVEVEVLGKTRR